MLSSEAGKNPAVIGFGMALPECLVSNEELAKISHGSVSPEWIVQRTGIESRYWCTGYEFTSTLAVQAGRAALANAQIPPEELTAIVVATMTPDYQMPSVASIVHEKIGAPGACNVFDINAACAGSVKGLEVAAAFSANDEHAHVLVIGADTPSYILNRTDRKTVALFGDGAGAAVVRQVEGAPTPCFVYVSKPDTNMPRSIWAPGGGTYMPEDKAALIMNDGHAVAVNAKQIMFDAAVQAANNADLRTIADGQCAIDWSQIRWAVPHQANKRMLESLYDALETPEPKRIYTVSRFGNTISASVLMALADIAENKEFEAYERFLATAVGAGYVGGAALMGVKLAWH